MHMGRMLRRVAATATVVSLTSLVTLAVPVRAATSASNGVGVTQSNQTVLGLNLGKLLGVNLLSDTGTAVTETTTKALASIGGLQLTSTLKALNLSVPSNPVAAQLPGGPASASNQLSLGETVTGVLKGVPALSGLGSAIDNSGLVSGGVLPLNVQAALATLTSSAGGSAQLIHSLGLVDGLASLESLTSSLNQGSTTDAASVNRTLHVDALSFLNLGSLLSLLTNGNLLNLPLSVLSSLLSSLGIPLPSMAGLGAGDLSTLVSGILATVTSLLNNTPLASLTAPVTTLLTSLLHNVAPTAASSTGTTGGLPDVTGLLTGAQATLTGLLNSVLGTLGNTPLLKINALDVSAATKAVGDTAGSVASATCTLGSVQIAGLPALSLGGVNGVLSTLASTVNTIVSALPLGLGNLLQLSICGQTFLGSPLSTGSVHKVSTANGVVTASAATSALSLGVHPEALLGAITGGTGLLGSLNVGNGLLSGLTSSLPVLGSLDSGALGLGSLLDLNGLVGGVTSILTNGISLDLGKVTAVSSHTVVAQGTPATPASTDSASSALPRTGGHSTPFLLAAVVLLLLALTARVVRRRA